jgi:hypothetical protein
LQFAFLALCLLRLVILVKDGSSWIAGEGRALLEEYLTAAATLPPAARVMLCAVVANLPSNTVGAALLSDDALAKLAVDALVAELGSAKQDARQMAAAALMNIAPFISVEDTTGEPDPVAVVALLALLEEVSSDADEVRVLCRRRCSGACVACDRSALCAGGRSTTLDCGAAAREPRRRRRPRHARQRLGSVAGGHGNLKAVASSGSRGKARHRETVT